MPTPALDKPGDLSWASFTDEAPWEVDAGRRPLAATSPSRCDDRLRPRFRRSPGRRACRRARVSCSVAGRLTTAVAPWLVRKRLNRYDSDPAASRADISKRLRQAAEVLGPTYIKLGQIISSGEGLFPTELVEEFKKCRDQVPPEPFEAVRLTVEQDLGARLEDIFESFDETALAAASIAQVHAARLRTGEQVVVKVQRPAVSKLVRRDLRVDGLARAAPRRTDPGRRARQPAGAGRAVRRDDRGGARLPDGSRQHARHRGDAARPRPARVRRPPAAPDARHPARAGDGARLRVQLRRRRRHEARRHRHRGRRPHRDDRVHGGRHRRGHLPRRPARRQPLRDGRRPHGVARLRHRRPTCRMRGGTRSSA